MKIDYQQIEQDFPKAYAAFKESKYYRKNDTHGYPCFDDRDLYDFFDEQEFLVLIGCCLRFGYRITDHEKNVGWKIIYDQVYNKYDTRTEAECAAFYAAFKLLEETL